MGEKTGKNTSAVLVTGGAGYIGSHACKALARAGYTPVTYDNLVYGHKHLVKWGPFAEGELADRDRLNHVIDHYGITAIMHFAAYAYVGESVINPAKYYRNNVLGSLSLIEAAREYDINKFIFSSTCATYGTPHVVPINEKESQNPINPYGHSKLMIEQMLRDFDHAYDQRFVALRYFNAAGADMDGQIGELHDPETHLIPLVIMAALGQKPPVQIFGTDYQTKDGSAIRDYIHVDDLANAHVLALNYLEKGNASIAMNLGTGIGHTVREIIESVERVSGKSVPYTTGPRRPGDPQELVADPSLAISTLRWQPEHTDIDSIVRSAWNWHAKQRE